MSNFNLVKLEDLVQRVKVGFVGQINEFYCEEKDGIPLIRTTDLNESGINYSNIKFVTKEFHKKNKKSQIRKGDVLIARHGDNGKASVFKGDFEAQVLNAVIIEPNQDVLDSELIKLFFESPYVKKQILGVVKGSVQGVINTSHVANLLIPLNQDIDYRQASKTISLLDRKIELNQRINAELEAMAKTLYDYWFVQNAKVGKWQVGKLGDFIKINERSIAKDYAYNEVEYIDIASVSIGRLEGTTKYVLKDAPSRARRLVQHGDIIWSTVRPNRKSYLFICNPKENLVVSTGFAVLTPKKIPSSFLYFLTTTEQFVNFLVSNAEGSAYPAVSADRFAEVEFLLPPEKKLEEFENIVSPILSKISQNTLESQTLTELRDWLLPMLMNGQVGVMG